MSKNYSDMAPGQITFTEANDLNDFLRFSRRISQQQYGALVRTSTLGSKVTYTNVPNCSDGCKDIKVTRTFRLDTSGPSYATAAEVAAYRADLVAFFNNVLTAVDNGYLEGFLPKPSTVFNGTHSA